MKPNQNETSSLAHPVLDRSAFVAVIAEQRAAAAEAREIAAKYRARPALRELEYETAQLLDKVAIATEWAADTLEGIKPSPLDRSAAIERVADLLVEARYAPTTINEVAAQVVDAILGGTQQQENERE